MAISTTCPGCKAMFRLADDMAGKQVKCQKCNTLFIVPTATESMTVVAGISVPSESKSSGSMFDDAPAAATDSSSKNTADQSFPSTEPLPSVPAASEPEPETSVTSRPPQNKDEKELDEPMPKNQSKNRAPKSNTTMIAIISVVLGGGLLSCCVCGGGGLGFWIYKSREKNAAPAVVEPLVKGGIDVVFDATSMFRTDNAITMNDPFELFDPLFGRAKRYKLYGIKMEQGRSYQIDLMSQQFDAFLHVQDDQNVIIARDDDGGDGLNSRLIIRPQRTGVFRIYATSLGGNNLGNYTLTVRRF